MPYVPFTGALDDDEEKRRGFVPFTGELDPVEPPKAAAPAAPTPTAADMGGPDAYDVGDQPGAGPSFLQGIMGEAEQLRHEAVSGVKGVVAGVQTHMFGERTATAQRASKRLAELQAAGQGDTEEAKLQERLVAEYQKQAPGMAAEAAAKQAESAAYSQEHMRPAVRDFNNAKTLSDAWEVFKKNPYDIIAGITAQSAPIMAPALVAGMVAGPAAGAIAMGASSGMAEVGGELSQYAQEHKVDLSDPEALKQFFSDPAVLQDALTRAYRKGAVVGTFDALSGGLAGKTLAPARIAGRELGTTAKEAINLPAQMASQMGFGAGGEAGSQVFARGGVTEPAQVLGEALGELGGAPAEVYAFGREARARAREEAQKAAEAPGAPPGTQTPPPPAPPAGGPPGAPGAPTAPTPEPGAPGAQHVTYSEPEGSLSRQAGLTPIEVAAPNMKAALERAAQEQEVTTDELRPAAGAPAPVEGLPQAAGEPTGEPTELWMGRGNKGFQTEGDAKQALPSRAKRFPDLDWRVEPQADGRFRLAGYARSEVSGGVGSTGTRVAAPAQGVAGQAGESATGGGTHVRRPAGQQGENIVPAGTTAHRGATTLDEHLDITGERYASGQVSKQEGRIGEHPTREEGGQAAGAGGRDRTQQSTPDAGLGGIAHANQATLNVGLNTNDGKGITPAAVRNVLRVLGINITREAVHQSDTEPTLAAEISRPLTPAEANRVSAMLKQEAIAQSIGKTGALYGPEASKWGDFNPEFFLTVDGQRLSQAPDVVPQLPAQGSRGRSMIGVHYSNAAGLSSLSPDMFGTGIKGAERERLSEPGTDPRLLKRVSFYPATDAVSQPQPEAGLGANVYRSQLSNIYDPRTATMAEREHIRALRKGPGDNALESAIIDAGYQGYFNPEQQQIVVFGAHVPVRAEGTIEKAKQVARKPEMVKREPETRHEGEYTVRRLTDKEMRAFARARKTATSVAPSATLEHGELRVKTSELNAFNAAIAGEGGGLMLDLVEEQTAENEQTEGRLHGIPVQYTTTAPGEARGKAALFKVMNAGNATEQSRTLDRLSNDHPDPLSSEQAWLDFERDLTGSNQVPAPPYRAITWAKNMKRWVAHFGRLTPHQVEGARRGFEVSNAFREAYASGAATPTITGKLMLWGMLSRMLSTHPHESAFLDAATSPQIDSFIQTALAREFTDQDVANYRAWSMNQAIPAYAPGKSATANLNAFGGLFLRKMSRRMEDGRSALEHLHDMMKDPAVSSIELRRRFYTLVGDVGIKNKVLSFVLLLSGRSDVMVLDRIQINTMWDAGRYGQLIYDDVASLFDGAHGLARYEALERSLQRRLGALYKGVGRSADASVGRYHWESWVQNSGQVVAHPTVQSLVDEAMGKSNPFYDIGAPEGRFHQYAFGAVYARDKNNQPYIAYNDRDGVTHLFSLKAFTDFMLHVKDPANKIIPTKFSVKSFKEKGYPWYEDPTVNRAKLDAAIRKFHDLGTIPRPAAQAADRAAADSARVSDQGPGTESLSVAAVAPTPVNNLDGVHQTGDKPTAADVDAVKRVEGRLNAALQQPIQLDAVPNESSASGTPLSGAALGTRRLLNLLAEKFLNKRLVWFKASRRVANGIFSDLEPGYIFIDISTIREPLSVLGHELVHSIRKNHPAIYKVLRARLMSMANESMLKHFAELNTRRAKQGMKPLELAKLEEEFVADVMGDSFTDPEFWAKVFKGQSKRFTQEAAGAILRWLKAAASWVKSAKPFNTNIHFDDFEAAMNIAADALRSYMEEQGITPNEKVEGQALSFDVGNHTAAAATIDDDAFALRKGTPPKKTVQAYKLFRTNAKRPGQLFPLFVDAKVPVPQGMWVEARPGKMSGDKVKSSLGPLAYRPGWHAGDLPIATHIGQKVRPEDTAPGIRPNDQVWALVEMAADVDYQDEANRNGINKAGKLVKVRAHITDRVPRNGFYRYKTNSNMTGNWLIGGDMKVLRVLSDAEVKRINDAAGVKDLPREHELSLDVVESKAEPYVDPQTQGPDFKRWFKHSVVVDEGGQPKVVYHMTNALQWGEKDLGFKSFLTNSSEMGAHFGTLDQARIIGELDTEEPGQYRTGSRIIPTYLSIQNPLRLVDSGTFDWSAVADQVVNTGMVPYDDIKPLYDMDEVEATQKLQGIIKAYGYDGIVYLNRREASGIDKLEGWGHDIVTMSDPDFQAQYPQAQDSYIAFEPTQIKSAISNKGAFDATQEDFNLSLAADYEAERQGMGRDFVGQNVQPPRATLSDLKPGTVKSEVAAEKITHYFDSEFPLIQAARKAGETQIAKDMVRAVEALPGRLDDHHERASKQFIDPLIEQLGESANVLGMDSGAILDAYGVYKLARHAAERNATLRANGSQKAHPSGMSDAEAVQWLGFFLSKRDMTAEFRKLDALLKAIQDETDRLKLNAGLLTQDDINARAGWANYINLQGDPNTPTGRDGGGSWVDDRDKTARGRDSLSANPVVNTIKALDHAVTNSEMARVKAAILEFARAHGNVVDAKVTKLAAVPMFDANGRFIRTVPNADRWAKSAIVYRNGNDEWHINFGDRAVAEAVKKLNSAHEIGIFSKAFSFATSKMARLFTKWNLAFPFVNAIRDMQQQLTLIAGSTIVTDSGQKLNSRDVIFGVLKRLPSAYNAAAREAFDMQRTGKLSARAREYIENGGSTGLLKYINDEKRLRNVQRDIEVARKSPKGLAILGARSVDNIVTAYSEMFELANRVAVYNALREQGVPMQQAVQFTKNLLNFNKSGTHTSKGLATLYMFARPALTDLARSWQMVATPKGAGVLAGALATAVMGQVMLAFASGDDEEKRKKNYFNHSEFERASYIILPGGARIPVGYGPPRWIWSMANSIVSSIMDPDSKPFDEIMSGATSIFGSVSPFPQSGVDFAKRPFVWAMTTFAPTAAAPGAQIIANRTALDNPIYSEGDNKAPFYTRPWKSTPQFWIDASRDIYQYTNGKVDVPAEALAHLFVSYGGWITRQGQNIMRSIDKAKSGQPIEIKDIPVVETFVSPPDRSVSRASREIMDAGLDFERRFNDAALHDKALFDKLRQDKEGMLQMRYAKALDQIGKDFGKASSGMRELALKDPNVVRAKRAQLDESKKLAEQKIVAQYRRALADLKKSASANP